MRDSKKLDFYFNASLTVLNLAKKEVWAIAHTFSQKHILSNKTLALQAKPEPTQENSMQSTAALKVRV
jgi:hypothetical protein